LLAWQWQGYARYHQSRANLAMHIVMVPLFLAGNVAFVVGVIRGSWIEAGVGLALTGISIALQGRGHRGEAIPPEPFTGAANAIARILLEQWITFPRFVLTGGWLRELRRSSRPGTSKHA
jgi:hypothetical protein